MIFIDKDYYDNFYFGAEISEDDFERFAARASDIVNFITFGRAESVMENMNPSDFRWVKRFDAVKKATAAQTEIFAVNGDSSYTGRPVSEISREELGNGAVSYDISRKPMKEFFGIPVSGMVLGILNNAGLLYRGI